MNSITSDANLAQAIALLDHYSFDLAGFSSVSLVHSWQQQAAPEWIRDAVIEALYQGRYKAVSVGQVLLMWTRRGKPLRHFNAEFDRLVCQPLKSQKSSAAAPAASPPAASPPATAPAVREDPKAPPSPQVKASGIMPPDILTRFKQLASPKHTVELTLPLASPKSPILTAKQAQAPQQALTPKQAQSQRLQAAIAATANTDASTLDWPGDRADAPPEAEGWAEGGSHAEEGPGTGSQAPWLSSEQAPVATHRISSLSDTPAPLQNPEPIRQFVPSHQESVFYSKLKSVDLQDVNS